MTEKYIYCTSCATLSIHTRSKVIWNGNKTNVWMCQECNPPLEDF